MRIGVLILFFTVIGIKNTSAQKSQIKGIVSIFNSKTNTGKRQFVSNASVVDTLKRTQPDITNSEGEFTLNYKNVPNGTSVSFQISARGLEVVNLADLMAISGRLDPVQISMAAPEYIADYRKSLYQVGKTAAERRLDKLLRSYMEKLAALQADTAKFRDSIRIIRRDLAFVAIQASQVEQNAQIFSNTYSKINLDDASEIYFTAFSLVKEGLLDSALQIINSGKLKEISEEAILEKEKAERKIRNAIKLWQFRADLLKSTYQFDSAFICYDYLTRLDSLNGQYYYEYANLLSQLHRSARAIGFYNRAIKIFESEFSSNWIYYGQLIVGANNSLAELYRENGDFQMSEKAYFESLRILNQLPNLKPYLFDDELVATLNGLGYVYYIIHEYGESRIVYLRALDTLNRHKDDTLELWRSSYAMLYLNLGNLYSELLEYKNADSSYNKAYRIYSTLAQRNSAKYEPNFGVSANNLGVFYNDLGDMFKNGEYYFKAIPFYLVSKEIFQRISKQNPEAYEYQLARTLNNLGTLFFEVNGYTDKSIDTLYLAALAIRERLASINYQGFASELASTLMNLGNLSTSRQDSLSGEAYFLRSLSIFRYLAQTNPMIYENNVADVFNNLGGLYKIMNNYNKAEDNYINAIQMFGKWINTNPDMISARAILCSHRLLQLYFKIIDPLLVKDNNSNVIFKFDLVESFILNLAKKDVGLRIKLLDFYGKREWYLLYASRFDEAEVAIKKLMEQEFCPVVVKTVLAHALLFQNKYIEALNVYKEIKEIDRRDGSRYVQVCLKEFERLEARGITNEKVARIREFLKL